MAAPPPFFPTETTIEERDALSEVLPSLFLTNWRGAEDKDKLKEMGVTHVAAVGSEFLDDEELFVYWKRDIRDDDDHKAEMSESMIEGAHFLHSAIEGGGRVLVHCAAGASRSVTVVLAYLLLHTQRSLRESFALVYERRPGIWPNDGFMAALIEHEASLNQGRSTIKLEDYVRWGNYDPAEGFSPGKAPALRRVETLVSAEEREAYRAGLSHRGSSDSMVSSESSTVKSEGSVANIIGGARRLSINKDELKAVKTEAERAAAAARGSPVRFGS